MSGHSPLTASFAGLNVDRAPPADAMCSICQDASVPVDCRPFYSGRPASPQMARQHEDCSRLHLLHLGCINEGRRMGRSNDRCPLCRGAYSHIVDLNGLPVVLGPIRNNQRSVDDNDVEEDQRQAIANDAIMRVAQREQAMASIGIPELPPLPDDGGPRMLPPLPNDIELVGGGGGGGGGPVRRDRRHQRPAPLPNTTLPPIPTDLATAQSMSYEGWTLAMRRQYRQSLPEVEDVTVEGGERHQQVVGQVDQILGELQNFDLDVGECTDPDYELPATQTTVGGLQQRRAALSREDLQLREDLNRAILAIERVRESLVEKARQSRNYRQYNREMINQTVRDGLSAEGAQQLRDLQEEEGDDQRRRGRRGGRRGGRQGRRGRR